MTDAIDSCVSLMMWVVDVGLARLANEGTSDPYCTAYIEDPNGKPVKVPDYCK